MGVNHMKKLISTLLAACVLLSLAACGAAGTSPQDGTETYVFTDDLGREVTAPAHPERVAAMIGSFADVWCLAGGRDSLVAAADDAWTSFDLGLGADVTNLGAVKEPGLEALIASEPDLILASCNTAANLELLDTFEAAGLCVAYFDVQTLDDPRLDAYARLTDVQLRSRLEPERGVFIAESGNVIERALEAGMQPLSLLMEAKWLDALQPVIARTEAEHPEVPVFVAPREELARLTGFELTRGALAAFKRPCLLYTSGAERHEPSGAHRPLATRRQQLHASAPLGGGARWPRVLAELPHRARRRI